MKDSKNIIIILLVLIIIGGVIFYFLTNSKENVNILDTNNVNNNLSSEQNALNTNNVNNNLSNEQNVLNTNNGNNNLKIDEIALESAVKKSLIEDIAKNKIYWGTENGTYAEGHKILRSEIKDNKVCAYVVAEIGKYKITNGEVETISADAGPMAIIFDVDNSGKYKFIEYIEPTNLTDDKAWEEELKAIFPADLVAAAKVSYNTDFYKEQIKTYLTK